MRQLSPSGQQAIADIAGRHGFSVEATLAMLDAVVRGNGSMAQFSHPEFGGAGQWMQGGMTMVGNMFDNQLKGWVDALCQDLSKLVTTSSDAAARDPSGVSGFGGLFAPASRQVESGWPSEFGSPNASGSQNGARYAYFAGPRRLVMQVDGETTVYDTGDHAIGGVSQQQSERGILSFTSQHGPVDVSTLPVVSGPRRAAETLPAPTVAPPTAAHDAEAVFAAIERLAALKQKGILSDGEFTSKKAELLRRV